MKHELQPTHVPFLDKLLGGGTAPTGVYGILGPTGVGKTHLASMIASNGATSGSVLQNACLGSLPWVLFDIETQRALTQQRILSHSAKVKRDNVWTGHTEIQAYEQERASELPEKQGQLTSELEHLTHVRHVMGRQLRLICQDDLFDKGPDGMEYKFTDFPAWIAECITKISSDTPLGGIVIDGVSNVWIHSQESSSMTEREFIQDFVDNFCRELSFNEQCPVWITHQVNGTACDASPVALLSHQDAARCKTFARSLDACFVLGNPSEEDNVFAIRCTRSKSDSAKLDRLLLTYDEDFATIVEADDYVEDKQHQTWKPCPKGNSLLDQAELQILDEMLKEVR